VGPAAINPRVETLAQRFRKAGFATAGVVDDCLWLDPRWGFGRGFDEYQLLRWSMPQSRRTVSNWITEHSGEAFFFFYHVFESHSDATQLPYESPGLTRETLLERFGVADYGCRAGKCASNLLGGINDGLAALENEEAVLRHLYAQSVREVDTQLGLLFDHLRRLGLYDDMMIVLTADHGEEFFDHGKLLHGTFWQEVIRAPLIIKWPRGRFAGERRDTPSGAVDVAATLLEAFGLPRDGLAGTPLLERSAQTPIYLVNGEWDAVIVDGMKAISDLEQLRMLLFDLEQDPGETRDLAGTRSARAEALAAMIAARIAVDRQALADLAAIGEPEPSEDPGLLELTPEERERLRSLGYLQ
jgi:arylsulfatase A-like enzyme